MPLNSFKLIFLCMVVSLFTTTKAQDPIGYNCENETSTNSAYVENLSTLFSFLSSNATDKTFYNDTILGRNSTDTVYGMFMCRGDIDAASNLCTNCVANATKRLSSACSLSREAVIWYDNCMVRYSNLSFFSTVDTYPGLYLYNMANISDAGSFMGLLSNTMNQTAEEAANSSDRYFTKQANVSQFQTLYCLAQCTQDLSPQNCATCLTEAIGNLPNCCEGKQGGRVLFPSCNVRFELYPFYSARTVMTRMKPISPGTTELVPETKYPSTDSEDAGYISHNCSGGDNVTASDSVFQSNLRTLLSYLSSNATVGNDFQTKEGTAYGLFTCRGDTPSRLCQQCVQNATEKVASECRFTAEAVIWFDLCWLRYSNIDFFSNVETNPRFQNLNITTDGDTDPVAYSVVNELSNKLAEMATETGYNSERYQSDSLTLNENQTVYILSQCSFDLSTNSCSGCLSDVIGSAIPWTRLGSIGGRVLYPSCILRFEFFKFYDLAPPTEPITPPTSPPPSSGNGRSRTIILIVVPITIVSGILFIFCCYLIRLKARKNNKTILQENFGHESSDIESLQFNLAIIEAATDNFSKENKIGKGGFGEVYKGILIDGRLVAVKRLSRNSKQGVEEFKNEVLLIAKLQHRNLVAFRGFCLTEQEKILIYEYVANKSLDYFLFDIKVEKVLSWFERYKIIAGIARGILYLHEHSRLKVIHRDLKPSNVLLDENMNPKISDFGLARIIEIDQQEGSTNRIIGTYGYMSPEYAMYGHFSEKSDVYSFGVMILEIISGKKNISSYEPHHVADGLLKFVWSHWRDETPLNALDPKLIENYYEIEVIKCIQIGLLCVQENPDVRPTMVTIVSYLSSHLIELPSPNEPTFLLYHRMDPIIPHGSSSRQSTNNSTLSINEMSISRSYPR